MTREQEPATDSWGDAIAKIEAIGPEGGTIRLPDGTVIEIGPLEPEENDTP